MRLRCTWGGSPPEVADYAYAFGSVGGDPPHGCARTLDGLVDCGCRSLPGRCQVRLDGGVLGRWLRAVLAVDHRGLYPTDRSARPVEQRRTLRSAAHALDRPGVHEADVCAGSRRYPWPMARPTPAQRHQLIGEEGSSNFELTLPREPSSHDLPHADDR